MFTALASKVIIALNYHNITDTMPRNEVEEEIHACVYTCYYFDKKLSLLLLRPPSLPELKVEPAQLIHLDPDRPTTAMITGIVEFAHLINALPNILLDTKGMGGVEKANALSDLVVRAHAIHSDLQVVREVSPSTSRLHLSLTYWSTASKTSGIGVSCLVGTLATRVAVRGLQLLFYLDYYYSGTVIGPQITLGMRRMSLRGA
jgi:hypothetical protein